MEITKVEIDIFNNLKTNPNDNTVDKKNVIEYLKSKGFPTVYSSKIFERMNLHHNEAKLTYEDYCQYMNQSRLEHRNVFNKIDKNKNGTISVDELKDGLEFLHLKPQDIDPSKLFIQIHHQTGGEITFDEFESIFAMLDLDDIAYLYNHQYSMLDGGSTTLLADYRKVLSSVGIENENKHENYDFWIRMGSAGIAGASAQFVVNPIETVKVRLQNEGTAIVKKYKSFFNGFRIVYLEEGVKGLWKGTTPALSRELIYTSSRMGLYKPIKDAVHKFRAGRAENIWEKLTSGGLAGGFAAFLGSPSDLLKARMQADSQGSLGVLGHIKDVLKKNGVAGLYVGASATIVRAILLGSVKMATYDEAKGKIAKYLNCKPGDIKVIVLGSLISSYSTSLACAPIDLVRTRMMTGDTNIKQTMMGTFSQVIRKEGFMSLYKGFTPLFARNVPYNILQFCIWEKICTLVNISIT